MAFEVFDGSRQRPTGTPTISIRPKGALRLNAEATHVLKSKGIAKVLILWDSDKHKLALSPAPDGDKRAYRVTYSVRGSSATIGAKTFASFIGFSAERSVSLPAELQSGMLQVAVPDEFLNTKAGSTHRLISAGRGKKGRDV